ncbi:N-acetylglucosamine-specific PTS transporter subunit IIBC [Hungatella hathewayi]|uniref:N-acetylglucosamine-specific PTS transporter subunit IIBC n=1 Tax=Hungatella hathewayi TaxID=154046 RepID=UPI0026DAB548|nr:N-acetylglucosamine-specific PTS transporter subunit IIBC [Hungatella hathewayi]
MMKYLQKLGKSLMLPVAVLPAAGILMGIGYWIDPTGWGANSAIAAFLIKAGGAIIDNMAILFAIGVAVGMADDHEGTAGLAGLVSWLMIQTILSTGVVAMLKGIDAGEVNAAFGKIDNQFIGILSGIIGSTCYNRFKNTKLPDALAFFSGKRSVAIVTALASLVACLVLFFVWPVVYSALVAFGEAILGLGAVGAGIYGFFNRLLIPVGLHHALNSVFWFDVAGVNDLGNFWAGTGTLGVTGQYMTGFFPVMMFGLPAAALAMYHTAKPGKKKVAYGLLLAAAVCSFFTGVTEPLEFAFMFLAPGLYLIHALLTGISLAICALLPVRAGFNFSAGFVDWFLSFKAPMAVNPLFIIPIGLIYGVIYYVVFRFAIVKFNFKTPGREDDDDIDENQVTLANNDYTQVASIILEGLGGKGNIKSVDNCITRLRLEINDYTLVNEKKIKSAGVAGVIRPGKTSVQVIVGTQVQFVADEFKKLCQ